MGYIQHHAIVVTSYSQERIIEAWGHARKVFEIAQVSPQQCSPVNGYFTFFIGPDGSKEGWGESVLGDRRRLEFIDYLRSQCFEDGSSPFRWAEVQYGDDNYEAMIVRSSDDDQRAKRDATNAEL